MKTALEFHPRFNAILGLNGRGKTNLLDAVYYSCLGKSYFSSGDRYVVTQGASFFRIEARFNKEGNHPKFIAKVIPGKQKELSLGGKKIDKIFEYIGLFPCIVVAPSDVQLLLEGSESRRKFINSSLVQYNRNYTRALSSYTKCLKQRNSLLKQFLEAKTFNPTLLESLSQNMYASAQFIYEQRREFVEQLSPLFSATYKSISNAHETCTIEYKSHLSEVSLDQIFKNNINKDRVLGRTSKGVHKDDIVFKMNGKPIKPFGSQGQLKSFILALKLAQYQHLKEASGVKPFLLLDDLFDKLDQKRVKNLLLILQNEDYGQVFLTDKDETTIKALLNTISRDYAIFVIDENAPLQSGEEE